MDMQLPDGLLLADGATHGGDDDALIWPEAAADLMPVSPSSVSNDSFGSGFSSQHTATVTAAAATTVAAEEPAEPMPRRPRTAYIFFTQAHRARIKKELEAKKGGRLSDGPKIMGKSGKNMNASNIVTVAIADLWKRTPHAARRAFEAAAAQDMARFKAEMRAWKLRQQQQQQRPGKQGHAAYVHKERDTATATAPAGLTPKPAPAAGAIAAAAPPSPPAALLSPSPPPMPPRPRKQKPTATAATITTATTTTGGPKPPRSTNAAAAAAASNGNAQSPLAGMPRKPPGAFLLWSHKPRGELRRQKDPQLDNGAVSRILGARWKRLTTEEKAPWIAMANARLEAYLVEKRAFLLAAGLPLPGAGGRSRGRGGGGGSSHASTTAISSSSSSSDSSSNNSNKRRKAAVASTAAAAAAAASYVSLPAPAHHAPVRLPPLALAPGTAPALLCKGEEKAEQQEQDGDKDEAAAEAAQQRAFWAAGGYVSSSSAAVAVGGVTGAGYVCGEAGAQQQQLQAQAQAQAQQFLGVGGLVGGDGHHDHAAAAALAGGGFDGGAMLLGGGGEEMDGVGGAGGMGAFLLDMDFSDIADEIFCDSPAGAPLLHHHVVG